MITEKLLSYLKPACAGAGVGAGIGFASGAVGSAMACLTINALTRGAPKDTKFLVLGIGAVVVTYITTAAGATTGATYKLAKKTFDWTAVSVGLASLVGIVTALTLARRLG